MQRSKIAKHLFLPLSLLFWIALWWVLAAAFDKPLLLPSPPAMLRALGKLALTGEFYLTLSLSLLRITGGIVTALFVGSILAFLTVKSQIAHHLCSPVLNLFKATPVASVIFLLLLWVGRDRVPFAIAFMMALPIVWANVREGLLHVDAGLLEMARVFAVPRSRILFKITLPSLAPYFLAAARSAIALAWKAGIAAEVLCVPEQSIGRAIYEGKLYLLTDELFAWTFIVVVISVLIEWGALALLAKAQGKSKRALSDAKEEKA